MEKVTVDLFPELFALCSDSVEAQTLLRQSLDDGGILAAFEIDRQATSATGHLVVYGEPSDRLRRVMAAMRAINGKRDSFGRSHCSSPEAKE